MSLHVASITYTCNSSVSLISLHMASITYTCNSSVSLMSLHMASITYTCNSSVSLISLHMASITYTCNSSVSLISLHMASITYTCNSSVSLIYQTRWPTAILIHSPTGDRSFSHLWQICTQNLHILPLETDLYPKFAHSPTWDRSVPKICTFYHWRQICTQNLHILPLETDLYPKFARLGKGCLIPPGWDNILHHHFAPSILWRHDVAKRTTLPKAAVSWRCALYNWNDVKIGLFIIN